MLLLCRQGHAAADCQFKDSKCHKCGKIGHIAKVCRMKGVNLTECIKTDLPPSAHIDDVIFRVDNRASQPYQVVLKVNNQPVFPRTTLQEITVRLCTYMAKEMPVLGQRTVNVQYGDYSGSHTLYVVKGSGSCLLGRDWLQHIRLDWASIKAVYVTKNSKVEALIRKYPEVFQSDLGTMKSFRAHLHLKEGCKPKFCRPRTVPFAIKVAVKRLRAPHNMKPYNKLRNCNLF